MKRCIALALFAPLALAPLAVAAPAWAAHAAKTAPASHRKIVVVHSDPHAYTAVEMRAPQIEPAIGGYKPEGADNPFLP